ncbi:MAG TPA: cell wall hydrolase [Sphingomicrobium sp.]|nr:cell wall hydrolase [Sphingomicrobium sp.]
MLVSVRSAFLIFAALSASSVAPAQVHASAEPLLPAIGASSPAAAVETPLDAPAATANAASPAILPEDEEDDAPAAKPRKSTDLAALVAELRSSDPGSRELECLAVGVYFESKSEPLIGQLAVGEVIANRASSNGRFPSSYCGVLFQRGQFSFVRGGRLPAVPRASRQWQTAVAIAKIVDQDLKDSAADTALFFHAKRVSPGWKLKRVASIGNHVFYR